MMPWKECSAMDERMQFVARRLAGEAMADLCREFGIARKTGYKIFERYQECGIQGLTDRSRRPHHYAHKLPFQVEDYILNLKHEHPTWGARKIRERLIRRFSGIKIPANSTIHALLDRHGFVERRGRARRRAQGTTVANWFRKVWGKRAWRWHASWESDYGSCCGTRLTTKSSVVADRSRKKVVQPVRGCLKSGMVRTVTGRLIRQPALPG